MEISLKSEPGRVPSNSSQLVRIAIVEDNVRVGESLAKLINHVGEYRVVEICHDGETALTRIPPLEPAVVLMDIGLPGISGIECVRQLKKIIPSVPVIMLTVYDDGDYLFNALKAGANGYLLKRTTSEKLVAAITEALLGGVPLTRQMADKVANYFLQRDTETPGMANLTRRERETLALLADGYRYKEIADRLAISIETVREYVCNTYRKLHVSSRTEAVVKYLKK